ncbi:hypothetical protein GQ55_5G543400 [Panicum hallii var. hallii]|uniref:Uncharacterized protein n=1 Tax=Panicum hallii var. hallii TaxID=1504633 RepID=A0A2T7DTH7_9POAL|nr:hypothetical protein GQ55_5G543400 [Panicum hallii var. hallii]
MERPPADPIKCPSAACRDRVPALLHAAAATRNQYERPDALLPQKIPAPTRCRHVHLRRRRAISSVLRPESAVWRIVGAAPPPEAPSPPSSRPRRTFSDSVTSVEPPPSCRAAPTLCHAPPPPRHLPPPPLRPRYPCCYYWLNFFCPVPSKSWMWPPPLAKEAAALPTRRKWKLRWRAAPPPNSGGSRFREERSELTAMSPSNFSPSKFSASLFVRLLQYNMRR